jgi:hypothetical protein
MIKDSLTALVIVVGLVAAFYAMWALVVVFIFFGIIKGLQLIRKVKEEAWN